ncbi:hypothetical protein RJ641_009691 [Dillenia turbinata]|uniref:RRM domain-containing protein n=1 Tax=Dillenia turbinata TaxID=194707 RepID=A0AAN8Z7K4_9MAGN
METPEENQYAAFVEKVKRTICVYDLSPNVSISTLKSALEQFSEVVNIQFIPNYPESRYIPRSALVEMRTTEKAKCVIAEISSPPFMIGGIPRPVRACEAKIEMFDDRPRKPGRTIRCCWINSEDPNFEVATRLKRLARKHAAEASFLLEKQLEEEEKLSKQQAEALKTNYKKYELIESTMADGTLTRLACYYNLNLADD